MVKRYEAVVAFCLILQIHGLHWHVFRNRRQETAEDRLNVVRKSEFGVVVPFFEFNSSMNRPGANGGSPTFLRWVDFNVAAQLARCPILIHSMMNRQRLLLFLEITEN